MEEIFQRDPALPFQEFEGRAVIVVPARRQMHQLDEVATFLWDRLRRPSRREDLVRALCEEFEVETDQAARDVNAFLAELEAKGLLRRP